MKKPFNYFLALCLDVARQLSVAPDWGKNEELCKYYGVEGGIRVTEDDEFLSDSPLLVKKAIDTQMRLLANPSKQKEKAKAEARGPKFDGATYTIRGKTYLRPVEGKEYVNPDIEERTSKPPEHWEEEKRKFIELAKQGAVKLEGIKYLVAMGLLTKDDVHDMLTSGKWSDHEMSSIIEKHSQREEELNEISEDTKETGIYVPSQRGADPPSKSDGDARSDPVERVQGVQVQLHSNNKEPT